MNRIFKYTIGIIFFVTISVFIAPEGVLAIDSIDKPQPTAIFVEDKVEIIKAKVLSVQSVETHQMIGLNMENTYQTLLVEILDGTKKGQTLTIKNDYILLDEGDRFFLRHSVDGMTGIEMYAVRDIDRGGVILMFILLFILTVIVFSGKQGLRSILSLCGSFFVILYLLIPNLIAGYPPVLTSIIIAGLILFIAIFLTHGFNRESFVAFLGTTLAVALTGVLASLGVKMARLSGLASDEAVYLNFNTSGTLDFSGLLLGGIMIGVLGILDDIAITQSAVVSELQKSNSKLSRRDIYNKALRVGREHVGALVNTLALAYTGAALPLLLLFSTSESSILSILNQEIFATEIIRTVSGSIGLILTVPITTLIAVYLLKGYKGDSKIAKKEHFESGHFH